MSSADRDGKRMVVYGQSGSGKTHLVKTKFLSICDRVLIFDPEEEYTDEKGFQAVETFIELLEILKDCWDSSFKICYVPDGKNDVQDLHEISCLLERLQGPYKQGVHNEKILFIVDEMHTSFPLNMKDIGVIIAGVLMNALRDNEYINNAISGFDS